MHAQLAIHLSEGFEKIPSAPLEWSLLVTLLIWGVMMTFSLVIDSQD